MNSIFFRLLPAVILLIIPLSYNVSDYTWDLYNRGELNEISAPLNEILANITATLDSKMIIAGIVLVLILFISYFTYKSCKLWQILLIVATIVGSAELIKDVIKELIKEQRPYISWVLNNPDLDRATAERVWRDGPIEKINVYFSSTLGTESFNKNITISNAQMHQYQNASKYSFPSGHTIFAVILVYLLFFFLPYVNRNKVFYITITLLMTCYAGMIEMSRIVLGMHYPTDVITSVILGWLICFIIFSIIESNNKYTKLFKPLEVN